MAQNLDCSVVIPCYNVEDYIDDCLKSVFEQEGVNLEVICVDNNSHDNTLTKLQAWQIEYPDLIVLQEMRSGACAARNKGLHIASAPWVQFLDADDQIAGSKIIHQMKLIAIASQKVDFVVGASVKVDQNSNRKTVVPDCDRWKGLFVTNFGNTCSNLWNKASLKGIGGWDESLMSSQESDLMYRLLSGGFDRTIIDSEPLTFIYERLSGQISKRNVFDNLQRYTQLRLKVASFLIKSKQVYWRNNQFYFIGNLIILLERNIEANSLEQAIELNEWIRANCKSLPILLWVKLIRAQWKLKQAQKEEVTNHN